MRAQFRYDAAKSARVLLAGIALSAVSAGLLAVGVLEASLGTLPMLFVGAVGVIFFGTATVVLAWRMLRKAPLVSVEPEGLVLPGAGLLRWQEIARVSVQHAGGQRMLAVEPVDVAAYLDRLPSVRRALAKLNVVTGFAPIAFAESALPVTVDELLATIARHRPT